MDKVFCTIFTPTYNRKELLKRVYESLLIQTNNEFEWLIVDDGSSDGTEEYINSIINENNKFVIIYKKKENGGKHRAINYGLDFANGEVFAIVDSDDYLTANAVEKIKSWFKTIDGDEKKFAGVAGQKGYSVDAVIGTTFDGLYVDARNNERRSKRITGDKFEVYYTEILKKNKFPEFENEKFLTEVIVWNRIANQNYYLRWFNDIICICEYLQNGLTDNRKNLIERSPKGYALNIKEQVKFGNISLKQKLGYYSFYYSIRKKYKNIFEVAMEIDANPIIILVAYMIRVLFIDGGKT